MHDVAQCGAGTAGTVLLLSTFYYSGELAYGHTVSVITQRGTIARSQGQTT